MQKARGTSLIEILISLSILSVGLLGIEYNQINSQIAERDLHSYKQAQNALRWALDVLSQSNTITPDRYQQWQQHVAFTLPNGEGKITMTKNMPQITIRWGEKNCEQQTQCLQYP